MATDRWCSSPPCRARRHRGDRAASCACARVESTATLPQTLLDLGVRLATGESVRAFRVLDVARESYAAAYQRAIEEGRRIAFPMPMHHVFG